jgi:hypothetical protein
LEPPLASPVDSVSFPLSSVPLACPDTKDMLPDLPAVAIPVDILKSPVDLPAADTNEIIPLEPSSEAPEDSDTLPPSDAPVA